MLTRLSFHNFKSWKLVDFELGPLTAFFGANSSGKSSITQFLLLLKQTKDSADRSLALDFGGEDASANLGSFKDAVFNHDESSQISWDLSWTLPTELRIADPSGKRSEAIFSGKELKVSAAAGLRGGRSVANDSLAYEFDGERFALNRERDRTGFQLSATGPSNFKLIRTMGRPWDLPGPTRSYAFPDQARTYFQNSQFISEFETAYVNLMDSILHLGPLREFPKRQYIWAGSSPVDVGRRGERTIDALLAAAARSERRNLKSRSRLRPFQEMVAWWLKELGLISSFHVEEIGIGAGLYRAVVKRDAQSPDTHLTDVGFGVSQVLPALVLLYYAPEGSIVILEQPEIHLHPAVQSNLADVIISAVKGRGIQVILESHSEHLLQRLLRRISEGKSSPYAEITPDDVKLYFSSLSKGVSHLGRLDVNLFGSISNWPKDFFGDQFGEAAARQEAAIRRRAEGK